MHLLAAQAGVAQEDGEAIDLGQTPGDIVFAAAADSELALMAGAADRAGETGLRLASLLRLSHNLSVDLWLDQTVRHAKLVVLRLIGGASYWQYGVDELIALALTGKIRLVLLPGDAGPDPVLQQRSSIHPDDWSRLHALFIAGGPDNADTILSAMRELAGGSGASVVHPPSPLAGLRGGREAIERASGAIEGEEGARRADEGFLAGIADPSSGAARHLLPQGEKGEGDPAGLLSQATPKPFIRFGYWHPATGLADALPPSDRPNVPLLFYRAALEGAGTATLEALIAELETRGLHPEPLVVSSLKDPASVRFVQSAFAQHPPEVILNLTGFALGLDSLADDRNPFRDTDATVIQLLQSGRPRAQWAADIRGLTAKDLAMQVVLPELDGRHGMLVIGHKDDAVWHARTQCPLSSYAPDPDGISRAVTLAANWVRLRRTPRPERRVAIVLGNYPIRDGRLANGVGYDAPQSTVEILKALHGAGYALSPSSALRAIARRQSLTGVLRCKAPQELCKSAPNSPTRGEGDPREPAVGPSPLRGEGGRSPDEGEATSTLPIGGTALIDLLQSGPTNTHPQRGTGIAFPLARYRELFATLPATIQSEVTARWGDPVTDPFCRGESFHLPALRFGNLVILIQPSRGWHLDETTSYHSPDLVPPHGYLAAYLWLRHEFAAHATIHNGKHGTLEWLPGKATALDAASYPAALWAELPQLYPFIVNDPGEGTQAKRRTGAIIIDHLVPPLTRAETYGPLKDLEALLDEYYAASGMDRRRLADLSRRILDYARDTRLDRDVALTDNDSENLRRIDTFLCDLKEAQIRDGLHIFGQSPTGRQLTDLTVALARVPRGDTPADASLIRALADDLKLGIDPLTADLGAPWTGPLPAVGFGHDVDGSPSPLGGEGARRADEGSAATVANPSSGAARHLLPQGEKEEGTEFAAVDPPPQSGVRGTMRSMVEGAHPRTVGDIVEYLEHLAAQLVEGTPIPPDWSATRAVLATIDTVIRPRLLASGPAEMAALLAGLDGKFIAPGPPGAPSRGRLDVLPTGRNFYSVDNRAIPTPTAWELGKKSAENLLVRHFQDHGAPLRSLALSVWGTAAMRTGGDDIAQALAFIGAKPFWDPGSLRLSGYEIIPLAKLGRPRVDVTLRISGFFRDAFPAQIALFDKAVRAIGALDEPEDDNPIAARMRTDALGMMRDGASEAEAALGAGHRIFGSKPGAYGAGLSNLIDSGNWQNKADLADAVLDWGQYAYGARAEGTPERARFAARLSDIEAVVHNQDNREHDLLDSDNYYQFEGGLVAAAETLTSRRPAAWHNDHSRPERPVARTLEEEISRVMRSRVVNPKWLDGVKRHGYKGAFEIIATLDFMFAFAATTGAVKTHHFDLAFEAFVEDDATRDFIQSANRFGYDELIAKFNEARTRGFWTPRSNSAYEWLDRASTPSPSGGEGARRADEGSSSRPSHKRFE
jgi:cobaltochelatase CobN